MDRFIRIFLLIALLYFPSAARSQSLEDRWNNPAEDSRPSRKAACWEQSN